MSPSAGNDVELKRDAVALERPLAQLARCDERSRRRRGTRRRHLTERELRRRARSRRDDASRGTRRAPPLRPCACRALSVTIRHTPFSVCDSRPGSGCQPSCAGARVEVVGDPHAPTRITLVLHQDLPPGAAPPDVSAVAGALLSGRVMVGPRGSLRNCQFASSRRVRTRRSGGGRSRCGARGSGRASRGADRVGVRAR